ncbi:MAG: hypothetical protein ABI557_12100 [Aureliella sp.]
MTASLLDQVIEPFAQCLTVEAARKIVDLKADVELQQRIDILAGKANRGELVEAERHEYDRYLSAFHFVTMMQAKARRLLRS